MSRIDDIILEFASNHLEFNADDAFEYCDNLKTVYFHSPLEKMIFRHVFPGCSLIVIEPTEEQKRALEQKRVEEEQERIRSQKEAHRWAGVCQHCGGRFTFFSRRCKKCGKKKDY